MNEPINIPWDELRERLLARREELGRAQKSTAAERKPVELDQTRVGRLSRMDALQVQAMAQATAERRALELRKIEAALNRMEQGDYGYCVACGEEISCERLELDPAATLCIDCAQERD